MVNSNETKDPLDRPGEPREEEPAPGYARLSLLRFRAWQILLVLVILVGVSFFLFPRERMLIDFHLERGHLEEALDEISRMLAEDPDNPDLLKLGAETHFLAGDMAEAIRLQERAAEVSPRKVDEWIRLASFYEWNRSPRAALQVYERLASLDPPQSDVLERLISHARYLGHTELEGRAVALLMSVEKGTEEDPGPLYRELTVSLKALAAERRSRGPEPLLDDLLGRLYLVRSDYLDTHREQGTKAETDVETGRAALHFFLVNGRLEEGLALARRLDEGLEKGTAFRLAWLDFLRWNGLPDRALALALELQEQEPENAALARLVTDLAAQAGDAARLVRSLERRLELEPQSESLRVALADLYRGAGDPVRAFRLYESLHRDHPQNRAYLEGLLGAAEAAEASALKEKAADLAGGAAPRDEALLRRRAGLYLAAEAPRKAWPLLSDLAAQSGGDRDAVRRMIEVAGYTNDPALVKKALDRALDLRPGDRALRKEAADAFLWIRGSEAAYRAQRELVRRKGATRADVFRLIDLAGYTGRPELERDALILAAARLQGPGTRTLEGTPPPFEVKASEGDADAAVRDYLKRYPDDRAFRDRLIQLFLDAGRPGRAAPLLAALSDRAPEDPRAALAAAESYLQADELKKGLPFFERALALAPEDHALRRRLVTYYGWLGLREKQIDAMLRLEEAGRLPAEERTDLAEALLERQEGARVLELLRDEEGRDPLPKREGLLLAAACELTGKRERALALYKRLARDHGDDPVLLAEMGDRALWLDRLAAAMTFYEAALRLDPGNLRALKGSGQIYAWNNNPERAMARFEAYNRLNPDDFEVRYQLGELYFANERRGSAFKEYDKTLRLMERRRRAVSPP